MTLKELYAGIGGDYDRAMSVLRIEKLLDKHIKKLPDNDIFQKLGEAGKSLDATALFETSHAVKGVCYNLGLITLAEAASEISEEFRPGNPRKMTDGEVKEKVAAIEENFAKTAEGIRKYAASAQ